MKNILLLLPLALLLAAPVTLRAQNMGNSADGNGSSGGGGNSDQSDQGSLPHMPTGFHHTPHAEPPPPEIAVPIAKFFNTLKSGDYANAYETFLAGSALGEQKEKMSTFISHTQDAFGIYGALYDYELYDNQSIGSNVRVLTYLTRHQRQPLRWRFIFYRAQSTWTITNLGFDDVLLDLLD
jgi:hypothetical protein